MILKPKFYLSVVCLLFVVSLVKGQHNHADCISFEKNNNTTATHKEIRAFYQNLAKSHKQISLKDFGTTDSGQALQEVIIDKDGYNTPQQIRDAGRTILFVNNGIHAGEPCGIDACMLLAKELVDKKPISKVLKDVSIIIIPVYNIGGVLNRGSHSRTNQNGPEAYGFRGNSKHLDLNRDFIKCDSKNALSFSKMFTKWNPDVFVDTHTSNGADYQYTLTLISSLMDKMSPSLGNYMRDNMVPSLYKSMSKTYPMIPYVYTRRGTPDSGIKGFMDTGRYSSGYAALHHCIAFITEAHMLKPYEDRVQSTFDFLQELLKKMQSDKSEIIRAKSAAQSSYLQADSVSLQWKIDYSRHDNLEFKGYEAAYKTSKVTGMKRLYYDHKKPYTKTIPYYNRAVSTLKVKMPKAYIIPQAYTEIIERLAANGVQMERIAFDEKRTVSTYYITDYKTTKSPYEGHYLHYDTKVKKKTQLRQLYQGDVIVVLNQKANRFIVETLEPQAVDSYFNWGYMDSFLQQKEYFSSYVFEDLAAKYLEEDAQLKNDFEMRRQQDTTFAKNAYAQLLYIYKRSPHYEDTHNLYPIFRVENKTD